MDDPQKLSDGIDIISAALDKLDNLGLSSDATHLLLIGEAVASAYKNAQSIQEAAILIQAGIGAGFDIYKMDN